MIKKIHPFLLAVLPGFFIGIRNIAEVSLTSIGIATLAALTTVAILLLIARLFSKNVQRNALIVSYFLIITFSYSFLYNRLNGLFAHHKQIFSASLILLLYTIFIVSSLCILKKTRVIDIGNTFLGYLTISMLCFIGMSAFQQPHLIPKLQKLPTDVTTYFKTHNTPLTNQVIQRTPTIDVNSLPDIYYIIVDGYARNDTLLSTFEFDNTYFTDFLNKKGFYIAKQSSSNYPMTHLSLSSSMSMDYINPLLKQNGNKDNEPYFELIKNSKIASVLKSNGYQYITIASGWGPTNEPSPFSDLHYDRRLGSIPNYYQSILMQTPLRPWLGLNEAKLRLFALAKLSDIPNIPVPKFTFVHLVMPHPPYLFDSKGKMLDLSSTMHEHKSEKVKYIEQLQFLNSKLETIVDSIISSSKNQPIIIIQADHGSEITLENFKAGEPTLAQIKERFSIFNAYYGPDKFKAMLYPTISPVNTFRVLLNFLNMGNWEILPDRNYFQWYFDDSHIYDVSEQFIAMNEYEH